MTYRFSFLTTLMLLPFLLVAQPNIDTLHPPWIAAVAEGEMKQELLFPEGYLFVFDGQILYNGTKTTPDTLSVAYRLTNFQEQHRYKHGPFRWLTIAILASEKGGKQLLATGWKKTETDWTREIDLLLRLQERAEVLDQIREELASERRKWVRLANEHNPEAHITRSYTKDAIYFSNGRRSDGHEGITERYSYMKNPNYQVDLEAETLYAVSKQQVLEVGRYFAGKKRQGDGGVYLILWEKQSKGAWRIALDFNF